jgi:hypothetical protein
VGPAILDLVGFVQATTMRLRPSMPLEEIVTLYREIYSALMPPGWDDRTFAVLWDHALMWRFMMYWLPKLAVMPAEQYAAIHDSFRAIWLEPVMAAAGRRLTAQI